MVGVTIEEFNERFKDGFIRFAVYYKNDKGEVFFVRDKASILESLFTNDFSRAYLMFYGEALNLVDTLTSIFSRYDNTFHVLKVSSHVEWDF